MAKESSAREFDAFDDLGYVLCVAEGHKSDYLPRREASEYIWTHLAEGTLPEKATKMWAKFVAKRLVDTVISQTGLDGGMRGRAALSAVGLEGQTNRYSQVQADLETFFELADWDIGNVPPDDGSPKRAAANRILNAPTPSKVVERYHALFQGITKRSDKLSEASKLIKNAKKLAEERLAKANRIGR